MLLLDRSPDVLDSQTPLAVFHYRLDRGDHFDEHVHQQHQLSWSPTGRLTAEVDGDHWAISPMLALWIPAGVLHTLHADDAAELYNLGFNPPFAPVAWGQPTVVAATKLLCSLAERLADPELDPERRRRTEAVLFDELIPVSAGRMRVPLPRDDRALAVARALIADPADPRSLADFGMVVGASERTLVRMFAEQTQLTFTAWRTQVRIRAALAHLEEGEQTGVAAARVGYRNVSAFIDAFRRATGMTPGQYAGRCASL